MLKRKLLLLFFLLFIVTASDTAFSGEETDQQLKEAKKEFFKYNNEGIDNSINIYKKILESNGSSAKAYAGLAKAYSLKGHLNKEGKIEYENDFNTAFRNMEKALQLDPSDSEVQRALAYTYLNLNRSKEALAVAEKLVAADKENFENLFLAWSADGKVPEDPRIQKVLESKPEFIPAHYELAESYYIRRRNPTKAITHFTKIVEVSDSPYMRTYLGRVYRSKRLLTRSIEHFDMALKMDPNYAFAKINKGISLHYKSNFPESTQMLLSGLAQNAKYPEAYYYLGGNYFRLGQKEKSIQSYNKFIEELGADTKYSQFIKQARTNMSKMN